MPKVLSGRMLSKFLINLALKLFSERKPCRVRKNLK